MAQWMSDNQVTCSLLAITDKALCHETTPRAYHLALIAQDLTLVVGVLVRHDPQGHLHVNVGSDGACVHHVLVAQWARHPARA